MSLEVGTRLGPYEIVGRLGAGGMGEVYRARDPRLGRDVAIKVLPVEVSSDPDRLRRFEQEARAVAALNHANILAVHDIGFDRGVSFIVTELLEGRSLRQLLTEERLAISRVIDLAAQVADGLAAAHGRGLMHRDIKPENLHVTEEGRAKILDFGLAKTIDGTSTAIEAPTQSGTAPFTVLGTAGYMAPEQVRGQVVDHRADIFAFGAVLYEMVTSRRAFVGSTVADTMSAILREPPSPVLSTPDRPLPPALLRIVDRCLDKAAAGRFQSTTDLAFALKSLSHVDSGALPPAAAPQPARSLLRRPAVAWTLALLGAAVALAAWLFRPSPPTSPALASGFMFTIDPPAGTSFGINQVAPYPEMSPDGQTLAFIAVGANEEPSIWIRPLQGTGAQPLPKTTRAGTFFWSADSRSIAFFQDRALKRIDLDSGFVQPITAMSGGGGQGSGTWGLDGTILFSYRGADGIFRVPATGGEPTVVVAPVEGQSFLRHPSFLDGRRFLYQSVPDGKIWLASLDGGTPKALVSADSRAVYAAPEWLLFVRDASLFAQRYDARRLELVDNPRQVVEDVRTNPENGRSAFSVSRTGVLVYRTGDWGDDRVLAWVNRKGDVLKEIKAAAAKYRGIALLADERTAIVHIRDTTQGGGDLFRIDLETGNRTPVTTDPGLDQWPVASPDGSEVAFLTDRTGTKQIWKKSSTGAGAETPFITRTFDVFPVQWTKDFFVFEVDDPAGIKDIWVKRLATGAEVPYLHTEFREIDGRLSPNGNWMAYQSAEGTGREAILVRPFPRADDGKVPISGMSAAINPFWGAEGREVIYVERRSDGMNVVSVPVTDTGVSIVPGASTTLFSVPGLGAGNIAITRDGQRFLIARPSSTNAPSPLTVLIDWTQRLDRKGR
jgi:serine/threonine protein kinase/Tol biopolymer transport system component